MKRIMVIGLIFLMVASLLVGCGQQKKYPDKPMEFVVCYSAGGGSDINARTIADIVQKNKFVDQPVMVVNKPGGSGAVGNAYVAGKKGDAYTLMTMNSGHALTPIVNKAEVQTNMFTPIANLALDQYVLGIKADSKYKTFEDMLKAVKESPESVTIGGVSKGSEDHLAWGLVNKYTGGNFKYVAFNGSGEVLAAVLGGHIDAGIFNPNECISQVQAGTVKPIVTYAEQRLSGLFKDAPTFKELGFADIVFVQFRSVVGPPGMPAEAAKFWSDIMKKVTETEQWQKDYCDKNLLTNKYMNHEDYKKFYEAEEKRLINLMKNVGILQ